MTIFYHTSSNIAWATCKSLNKHRLNKFILAIIICVYVAWQNKKMLKQGGIYLKNPL